MLHLAHDVFSLTQIHFSHNVYDGSWIFFLTFLITRLTQSWMTKQQWCISSKVLVYAVVQPLCVLCVCLTLSEELDCLISGQLTAGCRDQLLTCSWTFSFLRCPPSSLILHVSQFLKMPDLNIHARLCPAQATVLQIVPGSLQLSGFRSVYWSWFIDISTNVLLNSFLLYVFFYFLQLHWLFFHKLLVIAIISTVWLQIQDKALC